ncbi:DUF2313 domain-containing protein [Acutalibacter sp. 1XD8-33]|uniref:DUF2313 domain-containing protein n=1 Tax=Acutalibacter sp. 1XD8-33 TaxID=2320081 RepID=UPI000EA39FC5|nr:DUF2313 domain-containing protein [Acutalibacter sp. 1XD8-33]RKJ39021.1 DUF2313 domain-containing protein [Acutalibacter sp. 1XD8-33]
MTGGENIRRILSESGVYQLTGETPVDWEINAYEAGLQALEEEMEALEQDLFAATASARQLDRWEGLYRPQASSGELADRRRTVAKALAGYGGAVTLAVLKDLVEAAGILGTVTLEGGKVKLTVERCLGVSQAEAERMLNRLLPAHLEWEIAAE